MLSISQLNIYPVKSLGGVSLQQAQVTARGLQHDRRFMRRNVLATSRKFNHLVGNSASSA